MKDYETASYFYDRCLEVSVQFKYIQGEALGYRGLGICEESVGNLFPAMRHLETSQDKAKEGDFVQHFKVISSDLVRVYQKIADDYQNRGDFNSSLQFFENCLNVSRSANDKDKEAECYQQIGMIYEKQGQLDRSIEFINKYLDLCVETRNVEKQGQAHKKLAEVHSKNGDTSSAIKNLEDVLRIALDQENKAYKAEATLKLGLLYNAPGKEQNIKKSADFL